MTRKKALALRQLLEQLSGAMDDQRALSGVELFPVWAAANAYAPGDRVQRGGRLYKCVQAHTAQTGWEPENAEALWTEVCESHAGTMDNPIPYSGNMALELGKYYVQDDIVYRCTRDTGNPVYHALAELVGLYVEVA